MKYFIMKNKQLIAALLAIIMLCAELPQGIIFAQGAENNEDWRINENSFLLPGSLTNLAEIDEELYLLPGDVSPLPRNSLLRSSGSTGNAYDKFEAVQVYSKSNIGCITLYNGMSVLATDGWFMNPYSGLEEPAYCINPTKPGAGEVGSYWVKTDRPTNEAQCGYYFKRISQQKPRRIGSKQR